MGLLTSGSKVKRYVHINEARQLICKTERRLRVMFLILLSLIWSFGRSGFVSYTSQAFPTLCLAAPSDRDGGVVAENERLGIGLDDIAEMRVVVGEKLPVSPRSTDTSPGRLYFALIFPFKNTSIVLPFSFSSLRSISCSVLNQNN